MPKIVILGSCKYEPYKILAVPKSIPNLHNTEEGYFKACEKFYPAIVEADVIIVFSPDGHIGEHTQRDINYAKSIGKEVFIVGISRNGKCFKCGKPWSSGIYCRECAKSFPNSGSCQVGC